MTLVTAALIVLAVVGVNAFDFWDPAEEFHEMNTYFGNDYIGQTLSTLQEKVRNFTYKNFVKLYLQFKRKACVSIVCAKRKFNFSKRFQKKSG